MLDCRRPVNQVARLVGLTPEALHGGEDSAARIERLVVVDPGRDAAPAVDVAVVRADDMAVHPFDPRHARIVVPETAGGLDHPGTAIRHVVVDEAAGSAVVAVQLVEHRLQMGAGVGVEVHRQRVPAGHRARQRIRVEGADV